MKQNKVMVHFFRVSLFLLALSGFGQMPVFKRYYIADIPGLGWLAEFYVTHIIHYLSGAAFIASTVFSAVLFFSEKKRPDRTLIIRGTLYFLIITTGLLLVIKNFPGYWFSALFITLTDLVHLGSVILLFVFWLFCLIIKNVEKTMEG